jgi:hypothetical protein
MFISCPVHLASRFTVVRNEKKLIVDITDLNRPTMGRLYDDACDIGFAIRSERGNLVHFYKGEEVSESADENEIDYWICYPCAEDVRRFPGLEGWKVILVND